MEYQKVKGTDGQMYRIPIRAYDAIVSRAWKTDPDKVALLEALRELYDYTAAHMPGLQPGGWEGEIMDKALAAIARATGEDYP